MLEQSSRISGVRILYMIPIIGYLIRCMNEERTEELLVLLSNFLMIAAFCVLIWGYPALIGIFLVLAGVTGLVILLLTFE